MSSQRDATSDEQPMMTDPKLMAKRLRQVKPVLFSGMEPDILRRAADMLEAAPEPMYRTVNGWPEPIPSKPSETATPTDEQIRNVFFNYCVKTPPNGVTQEEFLLAVRELSSPSARVPSEFEYWQSVDVKLPDQSGWYHVWTPHGMNRQYECIEKAYFESSSRTWRWASYSITHWNFMPTPPGGQRVPF